MKTYLDKQNHIRIFLKANNIPAYQFARKLDVSYSYLIALLNGVTNLSAKMQERLEETIKNWEVK